MQFEELKCAIFDLAEEWNKKSEKKVPYEFITWLVSKLERMIK